MHKTNGKNILPLVNLEENKQQGTHICDLYIKKTNIFCRQIQNIFITNNHRKYMTQICHCDTRKNGKILKNIG